MTSKLNPRYTYPKIDRETIDGKRLYSTPDGARVPSVTTILDKTKSAESKRALAEWKKRVGTEQAQKITTEAANRGTRMHTYLEHYVLAGAIKPEPSNPFAKPSHAMAKVVINEGLVKVDEFWGMEVPLYFPGIYAGTTDCVGIHQASESILDFKQTNKPKREEWIDDYFLQLCAYAEAHNEVHGSKIKKGVILMCVKPDLDKDGLMTGKPRYQEFILEGERFEKYRTLWWRRVEEYYKTLV
jgi:genome maintenance exonuclease 1